ncbi:MAG: hypothetical protein R2838_19045 [Caldilineaceae bacterium]
MPEETAAPEETVVAEETAVVEETCGACGRVTLPAGGAAAGEHIFNALPWAVVVTSTAI